MKQKVLFHSLLHAILAFLYVSGVAWIMQNGERLFGEFNSFFGPVLFLLLFVLSATIMGTLVLGRPILLYLDGSKSEALKFFGFTVGWLFLIALTIFIFLLQL